MATQTKIQQWISKWLSTQGLTSDFLITQLAGDGSTRTFYRVSIPTKTFILLWDPDWTLSQDYPPHQTYLKKHGIPVPEFYASDPKEGALLMEDLGDDLLQHQIQKYPDKKYPLIEKSVALLAQLHGSTFPVPKNIPCSKRSFDKAKYLQELQFTYEHLNQKFLGEKETFPTEALEIFSGKLESITPLCFAHRDYHTRNILPKGNSLVLIDFQDARMGPPHYDLASILYDAYMPLSDSERNTLITSYKSLLKKYDLYQAINWESFDSDLKHVALQRTVKAAGSFASFYTRNGKTTHLPYLIPALTMALRLDTDTVFPLKNWIRKADICLKSLKV